MGLALWLIASADAQETSPTDAHAVAGAEGPDPLWETRFRRSRSTAHVGLGLTVGSVPVAFTGAVWIVGGAMFGEPAAVRTGGGIFAAGATGMAVGPMVLAGGAMRARRALVQQGVHVAPTLGWASWGLLSAAGLVLLTPYELDPDGTIRFVSFATRYSGSIAASVVLLDRERHATRGDAALAHSRPEHELWAAPLLAGDTRGVALGVSF